MKRTMSGLAVFVLILCTGMPVLAKGAEWKALNDEVMSLYRQAVREPNGARFRYPNDRVQHRQMQSVIFLWLTPFRKLRTRTLHSFLASGTEKV